MTDDTGRITYCVNGCTFKRAGERPRKRTTAPSLLCRDCEDRLHGWLAGATGKRVVMALPEMVALAFAVAEHGTVETAPGSKATKAAWAPAPFRLEFVDLLDSKYARIWNGTAPSKLRRGPAGELLDHAEWVIDTRRVARPKNLETWTGVCSFLDRHRVWYAEQESVEFFYASVKTIHRAFSDFIGEYRRPPVATCHIARDDGSKCGGPIYASDYGAVECSRCKTSWDPGQLRLLGMAQQELEDA